MQRRDLARYHDVAASTKTRGQGIGFAGVGIKLGLLVCEEVVTETRRGKTHVATAWHLASRHRAPWKWTPPPGLVAERGTAVRMKLRNALSPLLDPGFAEGTLRRQFHPLLDPTFDELLAAHYPKGVRVYVNGQPIERQRRSGATVAPLEVRLLRKRKPSALGYLLREDHPLPDDRRGLTISTFGKVIRRGWDWLGITPSAPDRIGGLIEAPGLAASLTLNKGDFIRVGARGAVYLAYRKAIQEAVSRQLAAWGDSRETGEDTRPRMLRPLERDLERVLEDLSDEFPLLASLIEHRAGGQKRLPIGGRAAGGEAVEIPAVVAVSPPMEPESGEAPPGGIEPPISFPPEGQSVQPDSPEEQESSPPSILSPGRGAARKPARYGLGIQFEDRPDDPELGRLVESTVWINQAHPAYRRAVASRAVGYHLCLAVALALAPLAVEPANEHAFVTAFLSRWGQALDQPKRGRRRS
jgi:hypothetical protein